MRWLQSLTAALLLAITLPTLAASPAPEISLKDFSNQTHTLAMYKGKVVLLNFWATWCGPCQVEMPHLQAMYTELKDQGLVVLGISADDARTSSQVRSIVMAKKLTYPVLLDTSTIAVNAYNPSKTLPFNAIIARDGTLAYQHSGYNAGDENTLKTEILGLLAQTTP